MLPIWYNAFRESSLSGIPILRPQYVVFPEDERGFGIDDQFYLGSSGLLCKPVTTRGATSESVYISDAQVYYDCFSYTAYHPSSSEPILPTRERPRWSSSLMKHDRVALDVDGSVQGEIYLDNGEGFGYERGELVWRAFQASMTYAKGNKVGR